MGDRTKVDSFLTQWELYCSINANNAAIQNQYQKMMLFLTYIQGDLVRVWVVAACRWLVNEVTNFGVDQFDPYLWESPKEHFIASLPTPWRRREHKCSCAKDLK